MARFQRAINVAIRGIDVKNLPGFLDGAGNIQLRDYVKDVVDDDGKKRRQGFFVRKEAAKSSRSVKRSEAAS